MTIKTTQLLVLTISATLLHHSLLPKVLEFIKSVQDVPQAEQLKTSLLSEATLAKDWLSPEEDEAWQDL